MESEVEATAEPGALVIVTNTPPATHSGIAVLRTDEAARVTGVVDGATIEVRIDGVDHTVRYIGMDPPAPDDACADEAARRNAALVEGRTVRLMPDVSDSDGEGRLLRYVYAGDTFVNAELLAGGWARAVARPPDTRHAIEFDALEASARASGLGCHASQPGQTPSPATTPRPSAAASATAAGDSTTYYVVGSQSVNARSSASTTGGVVAALTPGTAVTVLAEVQGEIVAGSAVWYRALFRDRTVYIHGSLLATTPPSTEPASVRPVE